MKEFGPNSPFIESQDGGEYTLRDFYPMANYYKDGRYALIHLYKSQGWQRLWVPEYYSYDVIESLKQAGLDLRFYVDYPGCANDSKTLEEIHKKGLFRPKDAILRVNYFGARSYRSPEKLPIAVVEDHSHDLIGEWALKSDAEWCIASLHKTLPIPEGGILWSPLGLCLPKNPDVCLLDKTSKKYLQSFNIHSWYRKKRENWKILKNIKKDGVKVLIPENYGCYPYSLILVFNDFDERERVRKVLNENQVSLDVLWNLQDPKDGDVFKFSRGMLSIPCDGRFSHDDILRLKSIIETII